MIATLGSSTATRSPAAPAPFRQARPAPQVRPRGPVPVGDPARDVLRLMLLRQLEDAGPLTGAQAFDAVAELTCSLETGAPGYPLLHELCDVGHVEATLERPPRYSITDLGRMEAERLASRCWPTIRDGLLRLNVCVGCLAPRGS
jgi:hypothetical protein